LPQLYISYEKTPHARSKSTYVRVLPTIALVALFFNIYYCFCI